jgi:hypothetical protein
VDWSRPRTRARIPRADRSSAPDTNYADGTGTGSDIINKANATVNVTGGTFTYDGNAHPATGTVTGVGGANLGTPTFVYTPGGTRPR